MNQAEPGLILGIGQPRYCTSPQRNMSAPPDGHTYLTKTLWHLFMVNAVHCAPKEDMH